MKFKINHQTWNITIRTQKFLREGQDCDRNTYFFGRTEYPSKSIYLCDELDQEMMIRTLKHELTHCYIWNYGLTFTPAYNDEMVCEVVANSNDFINEVVAKFERLLKRRKKNEKEKKRRTN